MGKQNWSRSSPCDARHRSLRQQHPLAGRDSCVLLSLAPSGEGMRVPHPPGFPCSPLTSPNGPQDAAGGEVPHGQPAAQLAQLHVHQLGVLEENCGRERERAWSARG